jgi:hypothetical protein
MIFKRRSKLFWVEAFAYAAIILVCMLGSFGVFDAKGQEISAASCEKWTELPSPLRIQILRFGMVAELRKENLAAGNEALIECLGDHINLKILDEDIVAECDRGGEEFLAEVFDRSLERIVFRCLKWVNVGTENFEADTQREGLKVIE